MKKERPILFSTPMVQAILEGKKTMTRRIMKPQPIKLDSVNYDWNGLWFTDKNHCGRVLRNKCPYGEVGDILWVRETWKYEESTKYTDVCSDGVFYYKADKDSHIIRGWKPSIFMPKEACRIRLEITNIMVERLNDISEEDAINEGVEKWLDGNYKAYGKNAGKYERAKDSFRSLWQSINGEQSWEANPWVWIIEFKQIEP